MPSVEMEPSSARTRHVRQASMQRRVMLLASSLGRGGAERQMVELANRLDPRRFDVHVASLSRDNPFWNEFASHIRHRHIVDKRWRWDVTIFSRLARLLSGQRIELVHAFHFDAEIIARLASRLLSRGPVVIGSERNSDHPGMWWRGGVDRLTRHLTHRIIANSKAGKVFRQWTLRCADDFIDVVYNGVDSASFSPGGGKVVRESLEVGNDEFMVAMVASFKPQKNHAMFFEMARLVLERVPGVRFLLVGGILKTGPHGSNSYHNTVNTLMDRMRLRQHCIFVGHQVRVVDYYRASDVVVLTSIHEGTPNVVLEAMACGRPVVVTDVADNREVVGDGGYVVPLDDAEAMANRVVALLMDPTERASRADLGRQRVVEMFSLKRMVDRTAAIYDDALSKAR